MNKTYKASRKSPSVAVSASKRSLVVKLTDNSVVYSKGILKRQANEVPYSKINSVNVKQGMVEQGMGYGDVIIMTGNDVNGIVLENIENPQGLKGDIMQMIKGSDKPASEEAKPSSGSVNDLQQLADLRKQDLITEEEYAAKKKQILGL